VGTRKTEQEWASLVTTFEESGQSLARFCATRGLKPKTFSWWRWQLRERERARENEVRMVEVATPIAVAMPRIAIAAGNVMVHVEVGTDTKYVAELVSALRAC
jgi:hypothetical protein